MTVQAAGVARICCTCSRPLLARGFRPGTHQFTEAIRRRPERFILALSISADDPGQNPPNGQWCRAKDSLSLDVRGLDDGPPLLDFGFLQRSECFGSLLVSRENLLPEVGEARTYHRGRQGIHNGGIELGDDIIG